MGVFSKAAGAVADPSGNLKSLLLISPAWFDKLPSHLKAVIIMVIFLHVIAIGGILFWAFLAFKKEGSRPDFKQEFKTKMK
jgi:hypothetical protein